MPLHPLPVILPLGDRSLLVRFGHTLSDRANRAAIAFGRQAAAANLPGVLELAPSLVSVLLRYDPEAVGFEQLAGDVRLLLARPEAEHPAGAEHRIPVRFSGEDLTEAAAALGLSTAGFIAAHCAAPLRVLATGFAPGFVYCGFHPENLRLARRTAVRPSVPPGTVLFAAGQTAIASTAIPTGWHVLGHTTFRNFDPAATPPIILAAGDIVRFEPVA